MAQTGRHFFHEAEDRTSVSPPLSSLYLLRLLVVLRWIVFVTFTFLSFAGSLHLQFFLVLDCTSYMFELRLDTVISIILFYLSG